MQNYEVLKLQGSQTSNMQATGLLESKRISVFCFNKRGKHRLPNGYWD